jgi:nucleotide-binding universal stress UspA family protein
LTLERWHARGLASDSSHEHLKQQGQAQAAARGLLDEAGCDDELLNMFGRTAETIVQVAGDHGCSGIVLGTRGRGDLENVFLASTSFKVVHLSELPVTRVKQAPRRRPGRWPAMGRRGRSLCTIRASTRP